MKEKWEKLTTELLDVEVVSRLDMILALLIALLSGVIIGFLTCPKRQKISCFGCLNGNTYNDYEEDGVEVDGKDVSEEENA